jgi:hypothetical protein
MLVEWEPDALAIAQEAIDLVATMLQGGPNLRARVREAAAAGPTNATLRGAGHGPRRMDRPTGMRP